MSIRSRNLIADKIYEVQKKLGNSSNNIKIPTRNAIRSNKILPELSLQNKVVSEN
jgi:hypothetical protein